MQTLTAHTRYQLRGVWTGWPTGKTTGYYGGIENGHHRFEPTGSGSPAFVPVSMPFTITPGEVEGDPPIVTFTKVAGIAEIDKPELMGVAEVAALVGVKPATVRTWRARSDRMRHPLPEPDWVISGVPIWLGETIRAWADHDNHDPCWTASNGPIDLLKSSSVGLG